MAIQFIINGMVVGALYAVMALGFSLIYHTTRVFHIAHGATYTVGAYLLYLLSVILSVWLPLAIPLAIVGAALLGISIQRLVLDPLLSERTSTLVVFISSLGVYIVLVNLIALLFGNETKIIGGRIESTFSLGSVIVSRIQVIQLLTGTLLIAAVLTALRKSRLGFLIRALADNEDLLRVQGVNTVSVRTIVLSTASGLAAVAAILASLDTGFDPHMGMKMLLVAAVATIVGGVGHHAGAVFAAVLIGLLHNIVIWQASTRWLSAVTFAVLVLVLLARPQGLFSRATRVEET